MQKRGRKCLSIGIVCGLLLGMNSGCARSEAEAPIEITLMHGWGGTLKTHNTMQDIYKEFAKENKDIVIKNVPYSDSSIAVEKANDMLAVGKVPDILSTNGLSYYVKNAVERNAALDLMPYIKKDKELAKEIHPSIYPAWGTIDGELYTIPDALEVSGYWYNESYLQQANVVDSDGNAAIPKTWSEFLAMTEKLEHWITESGQDIAVCSLDDVQRIEYLFPARLAGTGEEGIRAVGSSAVDVSSKILEETMADMQTLFACSNDVDNIENARQNFSIGKSALYFNGVWESGILEESKQAKAFQYANYPSSNGTLAYVSPSSGYVLAKQEDERKAEACVRFLKYMLSEKVQLRIALETGQAPSNPNIDSEDIIKQYPLFGKALSTVYEAEIQLKMIRAVWPEQKIDILRKHMQSETWSTQEAKQMAEELNDIN